MTADRIFVATGIISGGFACVAYCAEAGAAILNSGTAVQASANAQVVRIVAYLVSKGIPVSAAIKMAQSLMGNFGGAGPGVHEQVKFWPDLAQKLPQMVKEYFQPTEAH